MASPIDLLHGSGADSSLPRGDFVVRVESKHHDLFAAADGPDWVLIPIHEAQSLADAGMSAEEFCGRDTSVMTTTSIRDIDLRSWEWANERDFLEAFQPQAHLPGDHPAYVSHDSGRRTRNVMEAMDATLWLDEATAHLDTVLVPWIKGETDEERQICYDVMDWLDTRYCGVYTRQYFGRDVGYQKTKLLRDLRAIASSPEVDEMLTVGLQSPNLLREVLPEIVATAGMGWIWATGFRQLPQAEAIAAIERYCETVETGLTDTQTVLRTFAPASAI
jgi:hypothetical protein